VFSLIFIAGVILIYFFEIKWRKKHNKPLNKGKPIYGGQYLGFWMLGSIFVQIFVFSIVLFLEKYWHSIYIYSYLIFEHTLRDIYIGYTSSEPNILKTYLLSGAIPEMAFVDSTIKYIESNGVVPYEELIKTDIRIMSLVSVYRLQILIVTAFALIFGRKFIYAPFFELKKVEGSTVNKVSLVCRTIAAPLFIFGWIWFVFVVPMHSTHCPTRAMSFWCSNLGDKRTPYIKFPTLLLFYWTFLLILINAITQTILNELGYAKPKPEEQTAD
jgi:hypothetical protein